jgi:hypothetical protein
MQEQGKRNKHEHRHMMMMMMDIIADAQMRLPL